MIGFYVNCVIHDIPLTLRLIGQIRDLYPDSPICLCPDGAANQSVFLDIAARYWPNITVLKHRRDRLKQPGTGHLHTVDNLHNMAAMDCQWVCKLDPDTYLKSHLPTPKALWSGVPIQPLGIAGGLWVMHQSLIAKLCHHPPLAKDYQGWARNRKGRTESLEDVPLGQAVARLVPPSEWADWRGVIRICHSRAHVPPIKAANHPNRRSLVPCPRVDPVFVIGEGAAAQHQLAALDQLGYHPWQGDVALRHKDWLIAFCGASIIPADGALALRLAAAFPEARFISSRDGVIYRKKLITQI